MGVTLLYIVFGVTLYPPVTARDVQLADESLKRQVGGEAGVCAAVRAALETRRTADAREVAALHTRRHVLQRLQADSAL